MKVLAMIVALIALCFGFIQSLLLRLAAAIDPSYEDELSPKNKTPQSK